MQKWEYHWAIVSSEKEGQGTSRWRIQVDGDSQHLGHGLDLLGKRGWELVATHVSQTNGQAGWHYPDTVYVSKRPLEEPAD